MVAAESEHMYARILGAVEWMCPKCFGINKDFFGPKGPRTALCNRRECQATYVVGVVFQDVASGFKVPPADVFMPSERLIQKWRSGERVNRRRFTTDNPVDDENAENAQKPGFADPSLHNHSSR